MALKKKTFADDEIGIFDDAVIYKRGDYWHFRMWLAGEGKYARKSLQTRSRSTAIDKGKDFYLELLANQRAGKKYFSLTTKEGVAKYVASRERDVEAGLIVKGRLGTIKTHLEHWLEFIGRDAKLKELERTDCEDYFHSRLKRSTKKKLPISPTTVLNEQSTINAMMAWLFKNNDTYIDHFEFKKLPKQDSKDDAVRRATFTPSEIDSIGAAIRRYWDRDRNKLDEREWQTRTLACYYFLIASVTGLRTGEQRQLKWGDLIWRGGAKGVEVPLIEIRVRAQTSKVRQSRTFMVRDNDYFRKLRQFVTPIMQRESLKDCYVFSLDGETPITQRSILYHFAKLLDLAEIETDNRDIVPYSFRHYFITQKLVNGLKERQVADMCGTSLTQIERTYYHVNSDMMVDAAMADHDMGNDGILLGDGDDED
jgi:integrase